MQSFLKEEVARFCLCRSSAELGCRIGNVTSQGLQLDLTQTQRRARSEIFSLEVPSNWMTLLLALTLL